MPFDDIKDFRPLAASLCDAFESDAELDGVVRASTGEALYKGFVGRGDALKDTCWKLIEKLNELGRTTLFLAHVLASKPNVPVLRQRISDYCPAALTLRIDVAGQVDGVIGGINAIRARLKDPAVKAAVAGSRAAIADIARAVAVLEFHKNLHECLHQVQIDAFADLKQAAKQLGRGAPGDLLKYVQRLNVACTKARGWTARMNDPALTANEVVWIETLAAAAGELTPALSRHDAGSAMKALFGVQGVLRHNPDRLTSAIFATARSMRLKELADALKAIAPAGGVESPDLSNCESSLRDLAAILNGHVAEHKDWQDVDNDIWMMESALEYDTTDAFDDFQMCWPTMKLRALELSALSPKAHWSIMIRQYADDLSDVIAAEAPTRAAAVEKFGFYKVQARSRFFDVDAALRDDCAEIVKIGAPLTDVLKELGDG